MGGEPAAFELLILDFELFNVLPAERYQRALHDWCVGEMVRSHRGRSGSDIRLDAGLNGRAVMRQALVVDQDAERHRILFEARKYLGVR